ncbi:protein-glutamate O-methyltransferase CheR, partial [Treponema pallidum]
SLFGMNTKFSFLKTPWGCLYQKNDEGSAHECHAR